MYRNFGENGEGCNQEEPDLLGRYVAALSHDIKNILQILELGVDGVQNAMAEGDLRSASRGWDVVKRNIGELSCFTRDVLYLGKKQRVARIRWIRPGEVSLKAVNSLRWKADFMGVRLLHESDPLLPQVRLDPEAALIMLSNLILAALKACKRSRQVTDTSVIVRAAVHDPSHFRFEIEDNGPGFNSNTQEDPSEAPPAPNPRISPGLLVAEKICREHGGRMEVLDAPGKGGIYRVIMGMP